MFTQTHKCLQKPWWAALWLHSCWTATFFHGFSVSLRQITVNNIAQGKLRTSLDELGFGSLLLPPAACSCPRAIPRVVPAPACVQSHGESARGSTWIKNNQVIWGASSSPGWRYPTDGSTDTGQPGHSHGGHRAVIEQAIEQRKWPLVAPREV